MMPDWLRLILILLLSGLLTAIVAVILMARVLLQPPRMTDGKAAWVLKRLSPADLGLAFEPVSFTIRDDATGRPLKLAAWWIPHPAAQGRCAILLHGFADAKVGAIAWAPLFHGEGHNILALDLRAHGESLGRFITGGHLERSDLEQVIDQLRASRPNQTRNIVLFGVSLGAAVACAAAARRKDIDAVILDSPFADFRDAAHVHCEALGLPGPWIQRLVFRYIEWSIGGDFAALAPVQLLPQIHSHLLLVQAQDDPYIPPAAESRLAAAMEARRDLPFLSAHWQSSAPHLRALVDNPEEYRQRVAGFLKAARATQLSPAADEAR